MPRRKLLQVLALRIPRNLLSMAESFLQTEILATLGDATETRYELCTGDPEGSPPSPCLFDLYVGTLAKRLFDIPRHVSAMPGNLFAA